VSRVSAFREKPDPVTAKQLVADGYLWNSGNFMMRAGLAIAETERFAADIVAPVAASVANAVVAPGGSVLEESAYRTVRATSFDYAVMEKTERAAVVEAGFDWRDLGTWESLGEIAPKDAAGNARVGEIVARDSRDCYVYAAKGKVALIGVNDLVVAAADDAVLVAARDRIDSLREVVAALNRNDEETAPDESYKVSPWGYFQVVEEGAGYKVKRIVVEAGGRLSLQRHAHRAEHWVVVAGTAEVTVGDDTRRLEANQSVFIPQGGVHRLANPGEDLLIVIEVQFGDYLGEDDIERLADDYDRHARK